MGAWQPACTRCSKRIVPGTGLQLAGRAVHVRCLARGAVLESIERQDEAVRARARARAAVARARELLERSAQQQRACPICAQPLAGRAGGLLFHGERLVHARCWTAP
jgi:hypothetical protein